jgi:hypothetical protein
MVKVVGQAVSLTMDNWGQYRVQLDDTGQVDRP